MFVVVGSHRSRLCHPSKTCLCVPMVIAVSQTLPSRVVAMAGLVACLVDSVFRNCPYCCVGYTSLYLDAVLMEAGSGNCLKSIDRPDSRVKTAYRSCLLDSAVHSQLARTATRDSLMKDARHALVVEMSLPSVVAVQDRILHGSEDNPSANASEGRLYALLLQNSFRKASGVLGRCRSRLAQLSFSSSALGRLREGALFWLV